MTKRTYYIVKLTCRYNDTTNFKIDENVTAYCSMSDRYPQISTRKEDAYHFDKQPSRERIMEWDQKPWYYKITGIQVIEVEEEYKKTEKAVS